MFLQTRKRLPLAASLLLLNLSVGSFAQASVERDNQAYRFDRAPVYFWHDANQKPRAMAIAVHGLIMHGGTFDTMAKQLAADGIIVYAPDLRGYGRWLNNSSAGKAQSPSNIDYESSYSDLVSLIKSAREQHPDIPLYCIGESLGADLVLRAAGDLPQSVDGIVLSSPAVEPQSFWRSKMELSGSMLTGPWRQVDLERFIKKFASEDPQIVAGTLHDPLVRKSLSVIDLYKAFAACKPTLGYAKKVPENIPVLVIQGSEDRMVRPKAVIKLLSELKSADQTVRWFKNRGHLLIETSYVRPDTLETIGDWLNQRVRRTELARRRNAGLTQAAALESWSPESEGLFATERAHNGDHYDTAAIASSTSR